MIYEGILVIKVVDVEGSFSSDLYMDMCYLQRICVELEKTEVAVECGEI